MRPLHTSHAAAILVMIEAINERENEQLAELPSIKDGNAVKHLWHPGRWEVGVRDVVDSLPMPDQRLWTTESAFRLPRPSLDARHPNIWAGGCLKPSRKWS